MKVNWKIAVAIMLAMGASTSTAYATNSSNGPITPTEEIPGHVYTSAQLGMKINVPPANWSPLTAPDAELKEYGFPARPTDPAQLAQWKVLAEHAKHFIVPIIEDSANHTTLPQATEISSTANGGNYSSYTWGGYIVHDSTPIWGAKSGIMNVPSTSASGTPSGQTAHASEWVGVGGWNEPSGSGKGVVQDGFDEQAVSGGPTTYNAWYEEWPLDSEQYVQNLSISPGQQFLVDFEIQPQSPTVTYVEYFFENLSTGVWTIANPQINVYSILDQSEAEWITELPSNYSINTPYPYLADFGTQSFSGCVYGDNGTSYNQTLAGSTNIDNTYIISTDNSHPLTSTQAYDSSSSFTSTWQAAN